MHQLINGIGQLAQWIGSSPATMQITCSLITGTKRGYARLSPENKAKVDSIMIQAAESLLNAALEDVLGWAKSKAVTLGLSTDAAGVAEMGVRRIAEVGISKALEEMRS